MIPEEYIIEHDCNDEDIDTELVFVRNELQVDFYGNNALSGVHNCLAVGWGNYFSFRNEYIIRERTYLSNHLENFISDIIIKVENTTGY